MTHGKDIAWKQIGFVGGALVLGVAAGALLLAPRIERMKQKKKAKALTAKKPTVLKKTA